MESSPPAAAAAPSPPPAPAPAPAEPAPAPLNGEESPRAASPPPAPAAPASPAAPPPVVGNATSPRGVKRRASRALSNSSDDFRGFAAAEAPLDDLLRCTSLVDKMAAEVAAEEAALTPVRSVTVTRAHKRLRTDTVESSRPSSALSHRSDDLLVSSSTDLASSAASSPAGGRGRRPETASPLLRTPLERGWKRELVYRAALDPHARRNADVYYYSPAGKKLRSNREVAEHIAGTDLTLDHFTFFKEPLGVDDPDKEIIRDAKLVRRVESPASSPAHTPSEGKRTPKPKQPKGASPVRSPVSVAGAVGAPPLKLKVKFGGSRLSSGGSGKSSAEKPSSRKSAPASGGPTGLAAATGPAAAATVNNNNGGSAGGAPWKKPTSSAEESGTGAGKRRTPNGDTMPGAGRKRGRPPTPPDHFTAFYKKSQERNYNVVIQIFQYLGMRELAQCGRVSRLWRQLAATPALWRHVRMKNSHVSDWARLCTALAHHGTRRLDLRKMLLPQSDQQFWEQFACHIATVHTLERLELCKCPASAVEAVCRGLPGLRQLGALAVRDARLDPAPLARLTHLTDLRIKSMSGLALASDLAPLAQLKHLQHLSLTSIKDLGGAMCGGVVGSLRGLISLELGECTFGAEFGAVLGKLGALQRLRLERGTADCDAPALLRALSALPLLRQLELVNFDVKVGFDDALASCGNIQRLLIIPTYVSQSATTNKQVLSGVLRLKETLTHLMWGITIELLRVTELFIDQCDHQGGERKDGECIPVLKPVPGYGNQTPAPAPADQPQPPAQPAPSHNQHSGPPQVEILALPRLQHLLATSLPSTKIKLLRIPFHATWRQTLADFQ